jgi:hypothetical protein
MGDQNGDGDGDLGIAHEGLIQGRHEFDVVDVDDTLVSSATSQNIRFAWLTAGEAFEAAATGDLNGDGIDDLVLGLPNLRVGLSQGAGSVYVLLGPLDQFQGVPVEDAATLVIEGTEELPGLGSSLAVEDINGDGVLDLMLASKSGVVHVQRGPLDQLPSPVAASAFETRIGGLEAFEDVAITGGPDLDGDGYGDVVVAAPQFLTRGQVFVIRGLGL